MIKMCIPFKTSGTVRLLWSGLEEPTQVDQTVHRAGLGRAPRSPSAAEAWLDAGQARFPEERGLAAGSPQPRRANCAICLLQARAFHFSAGFEHEKITGRLGTVFMSDAPTKSRLLKLSRKGALFCHSRSCGASASCVQETQIWLATELQDSSFLSFLSFFFLFFCILFYF